MTTQKFITKTGTKAIWTSIEGEDIQYIGMEGNEEVTVQQCSKVMKTLRWPGGVPKDKDQFEYTIKKHLQGDPFLKVIYERK